jgi:hypothetical protein
MDDELKQLEAELGRLRPVSPSRELVQRVGTELATIPVQRRTPWLEWVMVAALPAAAVIALILTLVPRLDDGMPKHDAKSNPAERADGIAAKETTLKPVAAEKVLVSADDEGVVTLADGTPARRERLHYVDTITWKNPRTNASLTWSVPREEVRVVPIAFQ